jgi:hypothetical protein
MPTAARSVSAAVAPPTCAVNNTTSYKGSVREQQEAFGSTITNGRVAVRNRKCESTPTEKSVNPADKEMKALTRIICSLSTNSCDDKSSDAGSSIYSNDGVQGVDDRAGDSSLREARYSAIMKTINLDYWRPNGYDTVFKRKS